MSAGADINKTGDTSSPAVVKVWDPFVRIFHWTLVSLFVVAYFTSEEWHDTHTFAGYSVAALISLRIIWGFIGSQHARFRDFIYSPSAIIGFLKDSVFMRAKRYIGHNPAGGAMVIALLLAISSTVTSGYLMTTDRYWGFDWVRNWHITSVDVTLLLIAGHLVGVVLASVEHKENLVKSMFTGKKRAD
jgi:cytochrome b